MLGIPIGLMYVNAGEWILHKYVLHGLGKNKDSFWSFHWYDHHNSASKNGFYDTNYEKPFGGYNAPTKEAVALTALTILHLPLFPIAPFFTATLCYGAYNYYKQHKRSHNDPEWTREHMPWHYDHHMGPNQDANWCVTKPWFDYVMGTRIPYVGTEEELQKRAFQVKRYQKSISPAEKLKRKKANEGSLLERIIELTESLKEIKNYSSVI